MKKNIRAWISAFFVLALVLSFAPVPVVAAEQENAGLLSNADFMADAMISSHQRTDGSYEFELVRTSSAALTSRSAKTEEGSFQQESVKIIAPNKEVADAIEAGIQSTKELAVIGSGTLDTTPTWFLGSSLCLQLVVNYSSHTGQIDGGVSHAFYRIDSVTATAMVNSGTSLKSRYLYLGSMGITEAGVVNTWNPTYNITSQPNPYTTTVMATQPYLSGLLPGSLGATFECTATRPSGAASTYSVNCSVFAN